MTRSQRGQALVEYILLLVVVVSLAVTAVNSSYFKNLFGDQGLLADALKKEMEYCYRNGNFDRKNFGTAGNESEYTDASHPLYRGDSSSRFFSPKLPYPGP